MKKSGTVFLIALLVAICIHTAFATSVKQIHIAFVPTEDAAHYAVVVIDAQYDEITRIEMDEALQKGHRHETTVEWVEGAQGALIIGFDNDENVLFTLDIDNISYNAYTVSPVTVTYDDQVIEVTALLRNEVSMLDVREFYEYLGASVSEDEQGLWIEQNGDSIFISKIEPIAVKNNENILCSTPAEEIEGRIMLPAKDIARLTELHLTWNNPKQTSKFKTSAYKDANPLLPYYIFVNKSSGNMKIYGLDAEEEYNVVVKDYQIYTGRTNAQTPVGVFQINDKQLWKSWGNNVYSQYTCNYAPGLFIHSPLYKGQDENNMIMDTITNPTSGCVKTSTENCLWIYENCPIGTVFEIISEP